jgi:hypothetical protein
VQRESIAAKSNVAVAMGNSRLEKFREPLQTLAAFPNPLVAEHAAGRSNSCVLLLPRCLLEHRAEHIDAAAPRGRFFQCDTSSQ